MVIQGLLDTLEKYNWKENEKQQLLVALTKHGTLNIELVAKEIPSRSFHDVRLAVGVYSKIAKASIMTDEDLKTKYSVPPIIDHWIDYIKKKEANKKFHKDIILALKLIANFEPHTNHKGINFRDCYEYLATLFNGDVPKELNKETEAFLMQSFHIFADSIKKSITNCEEVEFLKNLGLSHSLQLKPDEQDTFVVDPDFNVLKIPLHLLEIKKPNIIIQITE